MIKLSGIKVTSQLNQIAHQVLFPLATLWVQYDRSTYKVNWGEDHVYFNSTLKEVLKKSSIGLRSRLILSRMVAPSQAFTKKRAS